MTNGTSRGLGWSRNNYKCHSNQPVCCMASTQVACCIALPLAPIEPGKCPDTRHAPRTSASRSHPTRIAHGRQCRLALEGGRRLPPPGRMRVCTPAGGPAARTCPCQPSQEPGVRCQVGASQLGSLAIVRDLHVGEFGSIKVSNNAICTTHLRLELQVHSGVMA